MAGRGHHDMRAIGLRAIVFVVGCLVLAAARPAAAQTLTLSWDQNPDTSVAGYMVYIRMPAQTSAQGSSYDVGTQTSFDWNGALAGQQYYFSVASYAPGPVLGARSAEVPRFPNLAPTLTNPGSQSTAVGASVALQLTAYDPEGGVLTYGAAGLPPGLQLTQGTGTISGAPSTAGSFLVTASVSDGALSDAESFTWTIVQPSTTTPPPSESTTSPPSESTTSPPPTGDTEGTSENTSPALDDPGSQTTPRGIAIALQLSGSDPDGSPVWYGAAGLPQGLLIAESTGKISGTPSRSGNYLVTATVTDGTLSAARTFAWAVVEPTVDVVAPVVTIALPTTDSTFATDKAFVLIGGSVSDDSRIVSVSWATDRGVEGTASGAENWIATIPLLSGSNTITVRARDAAGNVGSNMIVVKSKAKGLLSRVKTQTAGSRK